MIQNLSKSGCNNGSLGHPLARLLTPFTRSLAMHSSQGSRAPLRSLACSLTRSLPHKLAPELMGKILMSENRMSRFHIISSFSTHRAPQHCRLNRGFSSSRTQSVPIFTHPHSTPLFSSFHFPYNRILFLASFRSLSNLYSFLLLFLLF